MLKRCSSCGVAKPRSEFYADKRYVDGLRSRCRACHVSTVRKSTVRRLYGITTEQYESLLKEQRGVCAICNKQCSSGVRLAVDHDHSTGKARALLCRFCNTALGQFKDDPALLRRAADYIEKHNGLHAPIHRRD